MKNNIYNLKTIPLVTGRGKFNIIWIILMLPLLLFSCKEEDIQVPTIDRVPVLTASKDNLVLDQQLSKQAAVVFNWTPGSNLGTNAAIDYALLFDKKGNNFADPVVMELDRGSYSKEVRNDELNAMLLDTWNFPPGAAEEIEVRLLSLAANDQIEARSSNIAAVTITPFEPVTSTLYLIGGATPNGWSADEPTEMVVNEDNPAIFSVEVPLVPGSFKFITTLGQFLPSYNKGADDNTLVFRSEDAQPDEQFIIEEGGTYLVTVNLAALTISVIKQEGPAYNELWIVGEALPNGWDLDNSAPMTQNVNDPFIFTYNEILKEGEFKIATAKDWGAAFFRPTIENAPVDHDAVQLSAGDPDHKWVVSQPGAYKISLNTRDMTIAITPFQPYPQLWMVGDATPAGWNIDNPVEMVKDANDPFVFTYSGPLTPGEFKIPTATGNWGTDYFMPVTNHQDINLPDVAFIKSGNPDNKWNITLAGDYTITLNQFYQTISIVKN